MNETTGEVFTKDIEIDRENIPQFNVTITVRDANGFNDQTELSICICDINDNDPVFTSTVDIYRTSIDEVLTSALTFYTSIHANDMDEEESENLGCGCPITDNARLSYTRTSGDPRFQIDYTTGELY